jgi:hypothetical protein
MPGRDMDETPGPYASPACSLHEIDPAYAGLTVPASKTAEKTRSQSRPDGSRPSSARPRPARAKKRSPK